MIDCGNEIFDLAFTIFLIEDCTFIMYLNVLINWNYFGKNIKIATNRKTKYAISKKTLFFIQVSHQSHVVLVKEYFDEKEVIILACVNSLCEVNI